MSVLEVLHYPDARLRNKALLADASDAAIPRLAKDMLEVMYNENGIGLAATQVNVPKHVMVIDLSEERNKPMFLVNLEIIRRAGVEEMREGCLSVPGIFDYVRRAEEISVRAYLLNPEEWMETELNYRLWAAPEPVPVWGGKSVEFDCDGLLAICIQHETDHLNGKLFIDHLSEIKRERIRKKYIKKQQAGASL